MTVGSSLDLPDYTDLSLGDPMDHTIAALRRWLADPICMHEEALQHAIGLTVLERQEAGGQPRRSGSEQTWAVIQHATQVVVASNRAGTSDNATECRRIVALVRKLYCWDQWMPRD
jgi:hypothetical protein